MSEFLSMSPSRGYGSLGQSGYQKSDKINNQQSYGNNNPPEQKNNLYLEHLTNKHKVQILEMSRIFMKSSDKNKELWMRKPHNC